MKRDLDKLNTEELGKLFPVIISKPRFEWKNLFDLEKKELIRILSKKVALKIEHFGSTAIPNLEAKPTIDILVEIPKDEKIKNKTIKKMKGEGYNYILRKDFPPPYLMFVKGYTDKGIVGQSYHIHMAEKEHITLWDRLYFRDYLIENKMTARKYEKLKHELADKFKYDREAYSKGKTEFILNITDKAKKKYTK